jgi:hypothetical protein
MLIGLFCFQPALNLFAVTSFFEILLSAALIRVQIPDLPSDILQTPLQHLNISTNDMGGVPTVVWDFGGKLKSLWVRGNKVGIPVATARSQSARARVRKLFLFSSGVVFPAP